MSTHDPDRRPLGQIGLIGLGVIGRGLATNVLRNDGAVVAFDPAVTAAVTSHGRAGAGGEALVGVRHLVHDEDHPDRFDHDGVRRGARTVGDTGLVFDVLVRSRELPAALRLISDLPDQLCVVNHTAESAIVRYELEPWASPISPMARKTRVACRFSGIVKEADWSRWSGPDPHPYFKRVEEAFGPDRLLDDTDRPHWASRRPTQGSSRPLAS